MLLIYIIQNTAVQPDAHAYLTVAESRCTKSTAIVLFCVIPPVSLSVHGMPYTSSNAYTVSSDVVHHDVMHVWISSLYAYAYACVSYMQIHEHTCDPAHQMHAQIKYQVSCSLTHISLAPAFDTHSLHGD
jgi:hypothetical protein